MLRSAGGVLVALGLAALFLGWDTLLWLPAAAVEMAAARPETYGLIAAGILLMVLARLFRRRGP